MDIKDVNIFSILLNNAYKSVFQLI